MADAPVLSRMESLSADMDFLRLMQHTQQTSHCGRIMLPSCRLAHDLDAWSEFSVQVGGHLGAHHTPVPFPIQLTLPPLSPTEFVRNLCQHDSLLCLPSLFSSLHLLPLSFSIPVLGHSWLLVDMRRLQLSYPANASCILSLSTSVSVV